MKGFGSVGLSALTILGLLAGCSSTNADKDDPQARSTTSASRGNFTSTLPAEVDATLGERVIAVDGDVRVGQTLAARISPDLEGKIVEWGWHRCTDVPTCLTIKAADGPRYVVTEDDSWQVLRVIAVAERAGAPPGAVETRVGPVLDPDPEPFGQHGILSPSRGTGLALIVGPGRVMITVEAECPVVVFAGVKTATVEGSTPSEEASVEQPSNRHRLVIDSSGGQLTVGASGDCDMAMVTVTGQR